MPNTTQTVQKGFLGGGSTGMGAFNPFEVKPLQNPNAAFQNNMQQPAPVGPVTGVTVTPPKVNATAPVSIVSSKPAQNTLTERGIQMNQIQTAKAQGVPPDQLESIRQGLLSVSQGLGQLQQNQNAPKPQEKTAKPPAENPFRGIPLSGQGLTRDQALLIEQKLNRPVGTFATLNDDGTYTIDDTDTIQKLQAAQAQTEAGTDGVSEATVQTSGLPSNAALADQKMQAVQTAKEMYDIASQTLGPIFGWQSEYLTGYRNNYLALRKEMDAANEAATRGSGIAAQLAGLEYSPAQIAGKIMDTTQKGILKLQELDGRASMALSEMEQSFRSGNAERIEAAYKTWYDTLDNAADTVSKVNEQTFTEVTRLREANAKIKEATVKEQEAIAKAKQKILESIPFGEIDDVTAHAIATAPTLEDALTLAAPWLGDRPEDFSLSEGQVRYSYNPETGQYERVAAQAKTRAAGGSSSGGTGAGTSGSFAKFADEQQALAVIPAQLKNSEMELERFLTGIRQGLAEGRSPLEIADNLIGWRVENPDTFSSSLRTVITNGSADNNEIANVSRLINAGKKVEAMRLAESSAYTRAKSLSSDYIGENTAKNAYNFAKNIETVLNEIPVDKRPVGVVTGTMQDYLGRLRTADAARIKGEVTQAVAQMRNQLSGTAVTANEGTFLDPMIPTLGDRPDVFMDKVNRLKSKPLQELNSIRSTVAMPALDANTLTNDKARVNLYSGGETGFVEKPKTPPSGNRVQLD